MAADLVFYTHPMSRGRIVRWMLEETGARYETEILDYATDMKAAPYRAVNPMGEVPAIVHGSRIVTECAAICAYLADAFPEAGLAPETDDRAEYYRWLFFAAGPLEHAVTNHSLGFTPSAEQGRMVGYGSYDLAVDVLAQAVAANPYITGRRFTAADVYLGSQVAWGLQFGSLPAGEAFKDYAERVTARDAYQRAMARDDALMPNS